MAKTRKIQGKTIEIAYSYKNVNTAIKAIMSD